VLFTRVVRHMVHGANSIQSQYDEYECVYVSCEPKLRSPILGGWVHHSAAAVIAPRPAAQRILKFQARTVRIAR